jgi:Asp-tRNA(Asn)/Glu-tRNA(Gln) amidotransferase A subunit family amidase
VLLEGVDAHTLSGLAKGGRISCAEIARGFLDVVAGDELRAWVTIDGERLHEQARELDALSDADRRSRPLFGVPVGIKDNFDTVGLPTTHGSPIYAENQPATDAVAVRRLRAAGALIAGKTTLAEFASMHPPETINPIDPERTPGGSSTGSAVAVRAGHVPLATGTQTAGSVNRPASYCGVIGFKPTFGLIDRTGVKLLAESLDTVGVLARTIADAALVASVLAGTALSPEQVDVRPRLAFARTPAWDRVDADARVAIERAVAGLAEEVELPDTFTALIEAQAGIQLYEAARALAPEYRRHPELLSDELRDALERGAAITDEGHRRNLRARDELGPPLLEVLAAYDGVFTPSATGVPPLGLESTGNPMFSRPWNLLGVPSISIPIAWTDAGLPAALQLVGSPRGENRLLAAAAFAVGE